MLIDKACAERGCSMHEHGDEYVEMVPISVGEHEPFIYVRADNEKPFGGFEHCSEADAGAFPVYIAPPKREWVGLTDDDLASCLQGAVRIPQGWRETSRAIEAKLKEKNT